VANLTTAKNALGKINPELCRGPKQADTLWRAGQQGHGNIYAPACAVSGSLCMKRYEVRNCSRGRPLAKVMVAREAGKPGKITGPNPPGLLHRSGRTISLWQRMPKD
jgi:hypothetical protein